MAQHRVARFAGFGIAMTAAFALCLQGGLGIPAGLLLMSLGQLCLKTRDEIRQHYMAAIPARGLIVMALVLIAIIGAAVACRHVGWSLDAAAPPSSVRAGLLIALWLALMVLGWREVKRI